MIRLLGTSHISLDSVKKIDKELEKKTDAVCVELDPIRYESLKSGKRKSPKGAFMKILYYVQGYLGKSTGMMPGQDMLYGVINAQKRNIPCYLIDSDITSTIFKLKKMPFREKLRLFFPTFSGSGIDLKKIPDDKTINASIKYLKKNAPKMYSILIEERNEYMARWIEIASETHKNILVIVGAGHVSGLEKILKKTGEKVKRV